MKPCSRRPSTGGTAVREPVAMTMSLAISRRPPTSTSLRATRRASPWITSMPSWRNFSGSSCGSTARRAARIDCMIMRGVTCGSCFSRPNASALRMACASLALATSAFVGTQPVHKQSPPSFSRSMSATLRPSRAQPDAVTRPAVPPPITSTSY